MIPEKQIAKFSRKYPELPVEVMRYKQATPDWLYEIHHCFGKYLDMEAKECRACPAKSKCEKQMEINGLDIPIIL